MFGFTHSISESEKSPICFHCPACGERDVCGLAWTERQVARLLGIVPVVEERLHWVSGPCCERPLLSRVAPKVLTELDADAIAKQRLLVDRVSPVKIMLLLGAFLFCVVPVLGPVFFVLAWLPRGSSRPWFRVVCRVWLLLHVVVMNTVILIAYVEAKRQL